MTKHVLVKTSLPAGQLASHYIAVQSFLKFLILKIGYRLLNHSCIEANKPY
jgi:hypothetical protein